MHVHVHIGPIHLRFCAVSSLFHFDTCRSSNCTMPLRPKHFRPKIPPILYSDYQFRIVADDARYSRAGSRPQYCVVIFMSGTFTKEESTRYLASWSPEAEHYYGCAGRVFREGFASTHDYYINNRRDNSNYINDRRGRVQGWEFNVLETCWSNSPKPLQLEYFCENFTDWSVNGKFITEYTFHIHLHLIKVMLGLGKLQCGGAIGKYSGASHSLNHTIYLSNDADDSEADYAPIREG